jgi:hypothetical protein
VLVPPATCRARTCRRPHIVVSSGLSASPSAEHAYRGQSPYCGVNIGLLLHREDTEPPVYKGRPLTSRAHAIAVLPGTPPPQHVALQSLSQPSGIPTPFPCATGANRATQFLAPAESSPEQEVQRLAPAVTAAGHYRSRPNPNFRHKPIVSEPLALLLHFPGRPRRRILAGAAASMAQGPNCFPLFLSRVFCVNQGLSCEPEKLSKGLPENRMSNSK